MAKGSKSAGKSSSTKCCGYNKTIRDLILNPSTETPPATNNNELREDDGLELREDGGIELR